MGDYAEDVTKSLVDNIIKDQSLEQKSGTIFLDNERRTKASFQGLSETRDTTASVGPKGVSVKEFIAGIGFIPHAPSLHSSHRAHTKVVFSRGLRHW